MWHLIEIYVLQFNFILFDAPQINMFQNRCCKHSITHSDSEQNYLWTRLLDIGAWYTDVLQMCFWYPSAHKKTRNNDEDILEVYKHLWSVFNGIIKAQIYSRLYTWTELVFGWFLNHEIQTLSHLTPPHPPSLYNQFVTLLCEITSV